METGISDDSYIQVMAGLREGDTVAYIQTSSGSGAMTMGGMMGGGMPGGAMPGGGGAPSGRGSAPGGGGARG